ncbi:MAG: HK97 family phage prohead protease [Clostridiales bacterium]|jgi:HK97 family phage prohead protease|nr:HK97 family phage prohead protease [Clostridiales bacterium]
MPNNNPNCEYRAGTPALAPVKIEPLKGIIEGRPIVFNQRTNIADYFYEEIAPGALDSADLSDVLLQINHNDGMIPLARHRRGKRSTMDIAIDEAGMSITAQLDVENNTDAKMLCSAVSRGDVEGMSFAFWIEVEGDEWSGVEAPMPVRRITKIRKVFEVSAVNHPAYPQTNIGARSALPLDNAKRALDNARKAALDNGKPAKLNLEKAKFLFLEEQKQ